MKTEKIEISKGVSLRFLETDKFKTNVMSVYFCVPLSRENITKTALIPRVLKRGTKSYPTLTELSRRAEELYGSTIGANIGKRGDMAVIRCSVQFVSDSFISESIIGDVTQLLKEFIFCPAIKDGGFDETYVAQEKENAKNHILGLINDKKEYASVKCTEIMFEGDPYEIFPYGYVEDLEGIDGKNLYERYEEIINTAKVDIFVSGSFDKAVVKKNIEESFKPFLEDRVPELCETKLAVCEDNIEIKNVTEDMPVSQSKLSMGFNCGIAPVSEDYYAMAVFSCIYGGSPFSKLFNNVREKLSLAYYVFSAFDRSKSFMKINAGIEASKFDEAYNEIMLQLDAMKNGDFTDDEVLSAKMYMKTQAGTIKDSLAATEDFYMGRGLLGYEESVDQFLEKLNEVTRERIIAAANSLQLDTVYFLKGVQGNEI